MVRVRMSVRGIQGRGLTIQFTGDFVIIDMSGGVLSVGAYVDVHTGTETAKRGDKTMGNESGENN